MVMADVCDTFDLLLASDGDDYGMMTEETQTSGNIDQLQYTDRDKKKLRQFEGAAQLAKKLCKFL